MFIIKVNARFSAVLRSNAHRGHMYGSSLGHPWMHNPTKIYWRALKMITFHNIAIKGSIRRDPRLLCFLRRDSVGILLAKSCWTLGTSVSRWHQDMQTSTYGLRSMCQQKEGHWQIPSSLRRNEARGTRAGKTRGQLRHGLSRNHVSNLALQK